MKIGGLANMAASLGSFQRITYSCMNEWNSKRMKDDEEIQRKLSCMYIGDGAEICSYLAS